MKRMRIYFRGRRDRAGSQKSRKSEVGQGRTGLRRAPWVLVALVFVWRASGQQDSLLDTARQLDGEGRCAEAEALYQSALRSGAGVAVLNNFGNHYLACREPEKAAEIFERLLKIEPRHANANLQMARLAEQRKEPAKALAYLDRVAKPDVEIQMARAEALAAMGRRDAAARMLGRIGKSTSDPRILFALGMSWGRAGFYGEAEQAFQRVLERDAGDDDVLFNLGAAAARAGHFDRARNAFLAILKSKPDDPDSTYELGRVEASSGNYKRAVYLLAKARQAMPRRAEVNLALARAAEMGGFYGDAIAAYDEYIRQRPEDEFARRDRAAVAAFTRAGHAQARTELERWVKAHPDDAVGHYDLALAEGQEEPGAAAGEVERAIALDGRLEPARFYRAWLLEQSGKYEESLADAKAAVALKPEDARALDLLGLDYLDLARAAEAEPVLRKAMKAGESHPELMADVLFHMARCLSELGRREEARPLIARFQQLRTEAPAHPREQPGVIEAATLPPDELARRVAAEYRDAVAMNPNDARLRLRLAQALIAAGRADEAEKTFRDLLGMKPPADVARDAGKALLAERRYALAAESLRMALAETPAAIPAAWLDLALAEFFASGPDAALKDLETAPRQTATGDYHVMRAMILEAAGNNDAALSEMRESAGQPVMRARLAEEGALLLARHGEAERALELLDRAIRSGPEDRSLRLTRVAVLAGAGRVKAAEAAVKEMENRWPEWDRAWVADAMLLARDGRSEEAKARMVMAEALGARDAIAECAKERVAGAGPGKCGCDVAVWELIAGCGAKRAGK